MPPQSFGGAIVSSFSSSFDLLQQVKLLKSFGRDITTRPGGLQSEFTCNSVKRTRSRPAVGLIDFSSRAVPLRAKARFGVQPGSFATDVSVRYFLQAVPVAAPIGFLAIAIPPGQMIAQALNGRRLIKGDLTPLYVEFTGQKLGELTGKLIAKSVATLPSTPLITIEKTTVQLTDSVLNPDTGIEKVTGTFAIDPSDTLAIPSTEPVLLFKYQFTLTNGSGRVYTLESGQFQVATVV